MNMLRHILLLLSSVALAKVAFAQAQSTAYPDSSLVIAYEQEPSPTNMVDFMHRLGYPPLAKEAGIYPGRCVIRILVDENGKYVRHYVIKETHPVWQQPIQKAAKKIVWTPAIKDGKAVPAWVTFAPHICPMR